MRVGQCRMDLKADARHRDGATDRSSKLTRLSPRPSAKTPPVSVPFKLLAGWMSEDFTRPGQHAERVGQSSVGLWARDVIVMFESRRQGIMIDLPPTWRLVLFIAAVG